MITTLDTDSKKWRDFLKDNDHRIFHAPEWVEFIRNSFPRAKPYIFASEGDGKIRTIFPFYLVKSLFFGDRLISSAFAEYGGFAGDKKGAEEILSHIRNDFKGVVKSAEIRDACKGCSGLDVVPRYKRFTIKLKNEDSVWKGIQKSKRKAIKKAEREGVVVRELTAEDIDAFYDLYARNMKSFGSALFSKKYFRNFWDILVAKGMGVCFGAFYEEKLVAALLGNYYQGHLHVTIAVSDPKYTSVRPNDATHWGLMKWAIDKKMKTFDFGLVRPESGQIEFKRKWGGEIEDLAYSFIWFGKPESKELDPNNYAWITAIWRRVPLPITKLVGPRLREELGI